jgi:regulator of sigma E protease
MTIIYFLILLSMIIVIHEAGHLLAAKKFGVFCYEFSFGMGPLLWQKKGKETRYSIRAIPVGGYVSMAGEEDGDALYPDVKVPAGRRLTDLVWWKKIIIMLAGVTMNVIIAVIAVTLLPLHPLMGMTVGVVGILIAVCRVLAGVHFPRDVVWGLIFGAVIGWIGMGLFSLFL